MHGKITKILRLYSHGMGIKSISATLGLSPGTVRKYIRSYQELRKSINDFPLHSPFLTLANKIRK